MGSLSDREILIIQCVVLGILVTILVVVILACKLCKTRQQRIGMSHSPPVTPLPHKRIDVERIPRTLVELK